MNADTKVILKNLGLTITVLILVDFMYLYLAQNFFSQQVMRVQRSPLSIGKLPFLLTYVLMATMFYFLVIDSCALSTSIRSRYFYAFLMGIFVYGVFELTNKALFVQWAWSTVILDTIWGGLLFLITYVVVTELRKL